MQKTWCNKYIFMLALCLSRCFSVTCFLWWVISSGQHRSWQCSSPAVEASPLVLSWHVQGPDRPHAGAHAQPRGSSGGQEGGARVRPRAELLRDPQRKPESWPWGEDAAVDILTEMAFYFYMPTRDGVTFCFGYLLTVIIFVYPIKAQLTCTLPLLWGRQWHFTALLLTYSK